MFGNVIVGLSKQRSHSLVVGFHDLEARAQGGFIAQPADQSDGSLCVQLVIDIHRQQVVVVHSRSSHVHHVLTIITHRNHPVPFGPSQVGRDECRRLRPLFLHSTPNLQPALFALEQHDS